MHLLFPKIGSMLVVYSGGFLAHIISIRTPYRTFPIYMYLPDPNSGKRTLLRNYQAPQIFRWPIHGQE